MIKKILLILVLNLVFIFSNNLIFAEQNTDCEQLNGLDEYINETMADWNVPGMAIAIVKDGKAIYMKGFGYRDLDKKLEVTAETIFAIGSDSKAFTSAALGILVDEGKLDLDKPIKNYMPEFKLKKDYATDHVTPRDLLLHITGISRNDAILTNTPYNREELVSKLQYLKPFAEMRTKWRYNNFMYVTLGYLIEKITGKTWEEFVQEKILNPLDMKSTNFSVTESQKSDNYSLPYEVTEKGSKVINFANADSIGPAGSINSNVVDMSKWLILNLNEGKYNDKQIVSEEMMEEIHTPQFFISDKIKFEGLYYDSYALAWGANNYKGHRLLRHDGE
ncbi:MAG: serine hydrolase domain-containing protein, partial [Cyanobacteriota bacterium]